MQEDDSVGVLGHPIDRVLPAPVHPVGVELEEHEFGVGIGQDQVVDVVIPEALKLLKVVVVVEAHPSLTCHLSDLVEGLAAPEYEVAIAIREELDVAADLLVAEFGLIVQSPRENVEMQRVDVTPHDG